MDVEFHYYITYVLALKAGFEKGDAHIIAYSSQYTDDNTIVYKVKLKDGEYRNYISQTFDILKPQKKLMRIYPAFHFMPGSKEELFTDGFKRKDGKTHLLLTVEDNANGKALLRDALRKNDLFRIGIACHTYADTFAHQNFVGYYDEVNGMKGFPERLFPNIGHADAGRKPDISNLIWEDLRLGSPWRIVNNKERFLLAARLIYREFCAYTGKDLKEEDTLMEEIDQAIGSPTWKETPQEKRLARLKGLLKDGFPDYDRTEWVKEAFELGPFSAIFFLINNLLLKLGLFSITIPVKGRERFFESKWFRFQEAVKAHQKIALELLKSTFSSMEIKDL